jgi:hypothetical protein
MTQMKRQIQTQMNADGNADETQIQTQKTQMGKPLPRIG